MENDEREGCFCQKCGHKKILYRFLKSRYCLFCRERTASQFKMFCETGHYNVGTRSSIRMRHKRKGFGKFLSESLGGWFQSGDSRLPDGVEKSRIINKETDEYHEVVKKYGTDEIIHETHEPLSQHRKINND